MSAHPLQPMPVELMDTSTMNQPIPASQTMHQQSEDVAYQELPTPADDKINNQSETEKLERPPHPASGTTSDIFPTVVGSDGYPTAVGSGVYPTAVGSDEYPTPVSSPAPTSHTPGPQYSMGQGGYYSLDQKTVEGFVPPNPAGPHSGVAYYQQAGMPGMMDNTHDPENPAVGHAGVVSIAPKPPRKMVNCCGSMYRLLASTGRI